MVGANRLVAKAQIYDYEQVYKHSYGQMNIIVQGVGIMLQGITLQNWNYAAAKFLKKVMLQH